MGYARRNVTLMISQDIVVDAFLMALYTHQDTEERPLRLLQKADIPKILDLDREISRQYWAAKMQSERVDYKRLRNELLERYRNKEGWPDETRNLYASILSIIQNWKNQGGRDAKALAVLAELKPGANLILRYVLPLQLELPL